MRKLILASLTISSTLTAQTPAAKPRTTPLKGSLERRLATLLDQPPFNRANWGLYVVDDRSKVLFERNGDRFYVPASNTKLVVSAAATVLLPVDYRVKTSLYTNGRMDNGVSHGDLVLYGRGDPTWSERCFSVDSLAPGACDSAFTAIDAVADSLRARGLKRVTGKLVGDGSYFEPTLVHPGWNAWDLNWWYAAPVSGLGFHDNSVDFHIAPGAAVDQPPVITWSPELALYVREPRSHGPCRLDFDRRRQLLPDAGHLGHLGRGDRGARPQALDREFRAARPQPLRRAGARGRPDEEGRLSRRWHGQHDRLSHLPQRAGLLRAARRVPRPPAPGHHLPDSELEPELVR